MENVTITLDQLPPGLVAVAVAGTVLTTVKDGNRIVQRADAHLKAAGIYRATGYSVVDGTLTATGVDTGN
jgi:hypothetical protein